jgi:lipid-A-disaccharide synthase-like uncharacterized protein
MEKIIFYLIYILPILQILSYCYIDYKKIKIRKIYIIGFIFLIYFCLPFVINNFSKQKEPGCLLPVISMYGAFWIIGLCFTSISHLIYIIFKKILIKKPNG